VKSDLGSEILPIKKIFAPKSDFAHCVLKFERQIYSKVTGKAMDFLKTGFSIFTHTRHLTRVKKF